MVGEVLASITGAGASMCGQLHDVYTHTVGVVLTYVHCGLVDACAHGSQDHHLQLVGVPAGVGASIYPLLGQVLYASADNFIHAERTGDRAQMPIRSIRDNEFTILGTGNIGVNVAERMRGMGAANSSQISPDESVEPSSTMIHSKSSKD